MAVRVVAAEDSYLIREALRLLLDARDDLELVAAVSNLPDLLAAVDTHDPDVVVTDIRMPPGSRDEGIQAAERLATSHPGMGVVVLAVHGARVRSSPVRGWFTRTCLPPQGAGR